MTAVLTSLIESTHIDQDGLKQKFAAARVSYKGWSKSECDQLLPTLANRIYRSGPVLALVRHSKERQYWVLLPVAKSLNLDDESLSIKSEDLDTFPRWVLTTLLIRATPRLLNHQDAGSERLEADGLHYVVNRKKLNNSTDIITAVNIDSMWSEPAGKPRVVIKTITFTPLKAHEKPDGELPGKIAKESRYQLDMLGQNMTRERSGEYVKKTLWQKTKNRVPAFRLNGVVTLESYYKTRLGVLSLFLDDLHCAYGDQFKLTLASVEPTRHLPVSGALIKKSYIELLDLMKQQPIWITNHSDDAEAGARLQARLLPFEVQSELSQTIRPDGLNILLVNDKEQYKDGEPDPYIEARKRFPDTVIQSCYPERLKQSSEHVIQVLLKELFIKSEVQQRKLVLDYPPLPEDAWFVTSAKPFNDKDANKKPWPMFYGIVKDEQLELGPLPETMAETIKEHLTPRQYKAVFKGYKRADLIFWPENGDALTMTDTEALSLPDEPTIHNIVKELDSTVNTGVPRCLVSEYYDQHPESSISCTLQNMLADHSDTIPISAFRDLKYKSSDSKRFFDYLSDQGYRLKASMQSKNSGPLSSTSGIWIDEKRALYSVGGSDSAQRNQDNFNHIYRVEDNDVTVPDWFWKSLEVWHVKHRGATVYPYIFKHLREFAKRKMISSEN